MMWELHYLLFGSGYGYGDNGGDDYDDDYFKKLWRGSWQNSDIVAKILNVRECTVRISRDFKEEYPRLRWNSI